MNPTNVTTKVQAGDGPLAAAAAAGGSSSSQGPVDGLDLGGYFGRIHVQVTSLFCVRHTRCVAVFASAGRRPVFYRVSARFLPGFLASGRGLGRASGNDWRHTRRGMRSAFASARNLNISGHRTHSAVNSEIVQPSCSRTTTARRPWTMPIRRRRSRGLGNLVHVSMHVRR